MPGIVGFVGIHESEEAQSLLQRMAKALHDQAGFEADLYTAPGLGLGKVSLKISNSEPQPIWNEDHTICIVMEGEIFDYEYQKQELISQGHRFYVNNDPEFVLQLYEHEGDDFAIDLNGAFIFAIWDQQINKLVIANDRLGLYPIYYTQDEGKLAFASKIGALLADRKLSRSTDLVALTQFLTFDHVLGERTFLRDIKLLPPASTLVYQDGQLSIQPYWNLEFPEFYQPKIYDQYLEGLEYYLNQAMNRQKYAGPAGVLLSGGLDSRVVLAYLRKNSAYDELHTFTFGVPGCDDARFAREVAEKAGSRHHFYALQPDYLLDKAEEGIRLTEGMQNCIHMHALATLTDEVKHVNVIYKGFLGDALMGHFTDHDWFANYSEDDIIQLFYHSYPITFHVSDQVNLFTKDFYLSTKGCVNDTLTRMLSDTHSINFVNQFFKFDLRQRQRRFVLSGVELVRSQAMVRTPFSDNDLVDFMIKAPPGLRMGRHLIKDVFINNFPEFAKVPYTETGYPLMHCGRDLRIRMNAQTRWRLRAAGLNWISAPKTRPYADYNLWMRTALRDWVIDILLDTRSIERGYFRLEYIRKLVDDHMAGTNHAGKLGALITLELWHRIFID